MDKIAHIQANSSFFYVGLFALLAVVKQRMYAQGKPASVKRNDRC